jgi:hypothetical protein
MKLDEIEIPSTPASRAALEVAARYCSPALFNHSVRAYLWAASYATQRSIVFDAELLYVAAMLHDLALVKEFDNYSLPFEEAGGHIAWVLGAAAGWSEIQRKRAAEVIERHMWPEVDMASDPEGGLLELSTGMDSSGRQTDDIPASFRIEVLAKYPRLDFVDEVVNFFQDQAVRKPHCLAARYMRNGFAAKAAANPLNIS